jgi:hypothetical protein
MPVILATQDKHQEDWGSRPAQAKNSQDPILEKHFTKKGW